MRLLIIDDTSLVHQEFSEKLDGENIEIVSVYSRSEALPRLGEDYDLIICDLKMPADPTGGEPEVVHGLSVCDAARSTRPGIPVVILSAFGDINDLDDRLSDSPQEPFLGGNDVAMLRHKLKSKIDDAIELVREHSRRLQDLNREIEFNWTANEVDLSVYERQALLLYAAQRNGVFVRLRGLAGGRSGAKVVWIEIERDNGAVVGRGVAKIDSRDRVLAEYEKFRVYVADLLPAGSFATTINVIKAGASDCGLIVYSLANEVSLFHALTDADQSIARDVVESLFESTEPWHGSRTVARKTVREIRQLMVSDDELAEIRARHGEFIEFGVEDVSVQVNECLTHSDLHGGNVHVTSSRSSILIDFARIETTPACLDPITLEVSAIVHPDVELEMHDWPSEEQARAWPSPEYLDNCPIPEFIDACRAWLDGVKQGNRDRDATLYAYALRQLRFDEIDPVIPIALCQGAAERLAS